MIFEITHVEKKYQYLSWMEINTIIEADTEEAMVDTFKENYPNNVALSCVQHVGSDMAAKVANIKVMTEMVLA